MARRITSTGESVYFLLNHTRQAQTVTLPDGNFTSVLDEKAIAGQITIPAMDVIVLKKH
ncbi:Beta-galactosidase C-terminal domain [Dictyobacter vulcani]|uniref:Beta-galactosidase C-terminal domain n=1 Tax=Dictyobacter vulcani TaxID=2607529 RepID=UPI00353139E4